MRCVKIARLVEARCSNDVQISRQFVSEGVGAWLWRALPLFNVWVWPRSRNERSHHVVQRRCHNDFLFLHFRRPPFGHSPAQQSIVLAFYISVAHADEL